MQVSYYKWEARQEGVAQHGATAMRVAAGWSWSVWSGGPLTSTRGTCETLEEARQAIWQHASQELRAVLTLPWGHEQVEGRG